MFNDELGILTNQLLKFLIVGGVFTERLHLIGGNITGEGFALFPALEIVIGPGWGLGQ